jgi:hypothetical protein
LFLCVGLLGPTLASAKESAGGPIRLSPKGSASKTGTTKVFFAFAWSGASRGTYLASNSHTKFYVTNNTTFRVMRVSRNAFAKYVRASQSYADFSWKWKKNSKGKRYRYIYRIHAYYAD